MAAIGSLASLPFQVQLLEPADAPVPATPPELDGMTKAELLAFARKTYGQKLDSSLSKAEVLAAAKVLGRGPEPEAAAGSLLPSMRFRRARARTRTRSRASCWGMTRTLRSLRRCREFRRIC